jgi:ankyrin repeat protein
LHSGCRENHLDAVRELVKGGADLDTQKSDGWTLLMVAATNGYLEVTRYLLEKGADTGKKNNDGKTALDIAKEGNKDAIVKLLEV